MISPSIINQKFSTILAIETSCDDTACAIVEDGWKVHANVIRSSLKQHQETGGVVPEVAARAHLEAIVPVIEEAFSASGLKGEDIDAIAVTAEPGLATSLLIGTETAKWLGYLWKKPVIPTNHVKGHVYANWLDRDPDTDPISFPIAVLSVSGGHNEIMLIKSHEDWEILGRSTDDAAGEAFDKVARILGLGYPGGPLIEQLALLYVSMLTNIEHERMIRFPRSWLNANNSDKWDETSYDFSFSGLKSEVMREVGRRTTKTGALHETESAEIAFAFQDAVCDVLITKLIGAAKKYEAREIHLTGGVSANKYLRAMLEERSRALAVRVRWPEKMSYCTDNAAMIGAASFFGQKTS